MLASEIFKVGKQFYALLFMPVRLSPREQDNRVLALTGMTLSIITAGSLLNIFFYTLIGFNTAAVVSLLLSIVTVVVGLRYRLTSKYKSTIHVIIISHLVAASVIIYASGGYTSPCLLVLPVFPLLSLLFFNLKEIFGYLFYSLVLITAFSIMEFTGVDMPELYNEKMKQWLHLYSITGIITMLGLIMYLSEYSRNSLQEHMMSRNEEIVQLAEEITRQRDLLEQQNRQIENNSRELKDANVKLTELNNSLEEQVKERTQRLKHSNEKLTVANDELDMFIYRSSHDLKGPVARLAGLANLAAIDENSQFYRSYVNLISNEVYSLNQTLNKLLMINVINQELVQFSTFTLQELIADITHKLKQLPEYQEVNVIWESDVAAEDFKIESDFNLLKLLIYNLAENAVLYRNRKLPREERNIKLSAQNRGKALVVNIVDNGIGITPEQMPRIYNMFYRGSEWSKGNGLGLFVVRKAVEKLNGVVEATSKPGAYTHFTVSVENLLSVTTMQPRG